MKSFLDVEGVFDPSLRFAFTNITGEDFISAWGGSPIVVKAGETVELPHHLAIKLTGELVDKIMTQEIKEEESKVGTPYYRSPRGSSIGVPSARKVYEDKILRKLAPDEESVQAQLMRAKLKAELLADMEKKEGVATEPMPSSINEFAQIKRQGDKSDIKEVKSPLKVKKLK
jgi:hypothetical protein